LWGPEQERRQGGPNEAFHEGENAKGQIKCAKTSSKIQGEGGRRRPGGRGGEVEKQMTDGRERGFEGERVSSFPKRERSYKNDQKREGGPSLSKGRKEKRTFKPVKRRENCMHR